jgi:thioredoxin-like negative regulator of GroEL
MQWFTATALLCAAVLAGCSSRSEPAPSAERDRAPAAGESGVESAPSPSPTVSQTETRMNFVHGYAEGCRQSQATGKPMLVFFTAEWCRYCHQMASEAFGQQPVVAMSQSFICVEIDADAEPDVCQQFRVQAFPTVQFVSMRGVPLNRIVGKKPGRDVMMAMQAALQSVARRSANADPTSR